MGSSESAWNSSCTYILGEWLWAYAFSTVSCWRTYPSSLGRGTGYCYSNLGFSANENFFWWKKDWLRKTVRTHSLLRYQKSGRKICQMWHLNTIHLNSSIWAISISPYSCRGLVWGLESKPQQTQADLASSCRCSALVACLCHRTVRASHTLTPTHMHTYKQCLVTGSAAPGPFH